MTLRCFLNNNQWDKYLMIYRKYYYKWIKDENFILKMSKYLEYSKLYDSDIFLMRCIKINSHTIYDVSVYICLQSWGYIHDIAVDNLFNNILTKLSDYDILKLCSCKYVEDDDEDYIDVEDDTKNEDKNCGVSSIHSLFIKSGSGVFCWTANSIK